MKIAAVTSALAATLATGPAGGAVPLPGWSDETGYRYRDLEVPGEGRTGFSELSPTMTGIAFTNSLADERSLTNQILLNGSGVAAGDIDGDGWCDLYFCGLDRPNALYRNLGGWRFADITESSGVACADQASAGALLADVDGDGDLDLGVTGLGRGVRLFLNDGAGRFAESTVGAGLASYTGGTSLAMADIDGDADLDLYVANYRTTTLRDEPATRFSVARRDGRLELTAVNGRPTTSPDLVGRFSIDDSFGVLENGEADVLYLNDGRGRFTAVDWTDGTFLDEDGQPTTVPYDWTLSVMFRDLNVDGAPDLYVCSDFQSEDRIWINDGHGRFRAIERLALRHASLFTMGVDFADIDRDGHDDFFAADMLSRRHELRQVQLGYFNPFLRSIGRVESRPQYSRNMVFWNRGDGRYAEIANLAGVAASDWTWCPVFLDVDLDGYEDLLLVTGHMRDAQNVDVARRIDALKRARRLTQREQLELRRMFPRLDTPNFAFRNRGDLRFEEVGADWGFASRRITQGILLADLDNDGDLDVVANCLNDGPLLCRNESVAPRLAVRLRGQSPNTDGIGSRITVRQTGMPTQSQEILRGGRYLSSDDAVRVFAVAPGSEAPSVRVKWRSGRESVVRRAQPNRLYEIDERPAPLAPPAAQAATKQTSPLFADVSDLLRHRHVDAPYDELTRQPLLPRELSRLGPGISWFDFDGDGWEDLIVASGRGGRLGFFRNDQQGGFKRLRHPALNTDAERDQTAVLGWYPASDRPSLILGLANYETDTNIASVACEYDLTKTEPSASLPLTLSSVGPLAMTDRDGDHDLDLFVGGRVRPGRYPEPASSGLFSWDGNSWRPEIRAPFEDIGLVSAAVWTDLDGDGLPELVLACEWGPLRVFRGGTLAEVTREVGLADYVGWWSSVSAGDFDGDGRMDLVAGNWGRNTRHQARSGPELHLYYGDLNGDETLELVEAYHDDELGKIVPYRDWETLSRAMPFIRENYETFAAFSTAGVEEFLGDRAKEMQRLTANTLDTMLFLNRGDRFEARALRIEAQLAPVFGIAVGDLDGDGREDLFLSQNFFGVSPDSARLDAGRGLWLKGDGRGGFSAMPSVVSGISVDGEGRGAALADYDHDGRVDLAVGQNGNATKLYRNQGALPGLRVRLVGPPGNPRGLGATVRLQTSGRGTGPAREMRAGAGYWSQDSATVVMARVRAEDSVFVRWPGGETQTVPIPGREQELVIPWPGTAAP